MIVCTLPIFIKICTYNSQSTSPWTIVKLEATWTVMGSILHIEVSYPHPVTCITTTAAAIHSTVHIYCCSIATLYPIVA